ncbi:uncharacterized protein [Setaria viridis]|uniref:uncharacterized protein n=1 Tax=Setaria viridis TaxID=4556 RepID=UPI003B3B6CC8
MLSALSSKEGIWRSNRPFISLVGRARRSKKLAAKGKEKRDYTNAHGGDHDAGKETELALKIGNVNYCETGDTVDKRGPKIVDGIKNATASQLDVADSGSLSDLVSQVEVVVCLLPTSFHDGAPLAG